MVIIARVVCYKLFKSGSAAHLRLKLVLAISVLYLLFRPWLSWKGYNASSDDHALGLNSTAGSLYEDIHMSMTSLTGFLNGLKVDTESEIIHVVPAVLIGERVPNCGLPEPCANDSFAVHIFTGKDHHDQPRLCVDGKYILGANLNSGGRGMNVAVIDSVTRFVQHVSHFDTYEEDSSQLETLLLNLRQGDILILLTFDEPTRKLSQIARLLLHELGSAMAQNLHYRSSWYFITQKGISGFSPYEDLHFVEAKGWAVPHDTRFCIPFQMSGRSIHPDPRPQENLARRHFCKKYQHFSSFCSGDVVDNSLSPNPSVRYPSSKIFSTPVIVMSGEDVRHLPLTLETLVMQPGIKPHRVVVFYLPENPEVKELCDLFEFAAEQIDTAKIGKPCDQFTEAFELAKRLFPDAVHFVVIEEGVLLGPDFLAYIGQLLPLLEMDSTISSISAWNDNGFQGVSGNNKRLFRVESLTGMGFLVRRGFPAATWCERRFVLEGSPSGGDTISPDVSRVMRISDLVYDDETPFSEAIGALLSQERVTDMELGVTIGGVETLERSHYEKVLHGMLSTCETWVLIQRYLTLCSTGSWLPHLSSSTASNRPPISIFFHQASKDDFETLRALCSCFGLYHHPKFSPRGLYRGMLRFTWKGRDMFLIGRYSPYYKYKPKNTSPVSLRIATSG
nr:protein O-linked-mannose beta-1,2-N-acetylglucosaminyltransferase 1-like isoform X1 [Rhipicephalus microplus]